MAEFLNMGGYAAFIWPSWIIAVVVILGITLLSYSHDKKIKQGIERLDAASKANHGKTSQSGGSVSSNNTAATKGLDHG